MIYESEARNLAEVGSKSSEIVREMNYESEAPRLVEVASKSSEIVHEMIYEDEARNLLEVASKSPEIVRKNSRISYSRELLLSLSEADNCKELPTGVDESTFRDLRISYTRDHLLSLAEVNWCKELPYGFDQSIISDLQNACKRAPEILELQRHKSVSAGEFLGTSIWEHSERWDSFKLSTADGAYKSAPDIKKSQGHVSPAGGRMSGVSAEESAERWDSAKLINADSKSTGSEKFNGQQLRRPWANPITIGITRNTSENPEQSSILGNSSVMKSLPDGSEMSTLKPPGSDSLLSRCSQPYRPPFYFKSRPDTQKHDLASSKSYGHAEVPSKQRATEDSWIKASDEIKTNEPLISIEEKQKSNGLDEVISKSLEEHSALQVVNRFRVSPPIISSVSTSPEFPSSSSRTTENCPTEDSLTDQPIIEGQEVTYQVETLQPQVQEGGRFSALIILEDAEEVDPDLIDEANLASNDKTRDDQRVIAGNVRFGKTRKKRLRSQVAPFTTRTENITINSFQNNTARKTAAKSSDMKASMSSAVFIKPSYKTSNSQGGFVAQEQKGFDVSSKNLPKGFPKKASVADHLATEAKVSIGSVSEIWHPSHRTKHQDIIVDSRNSCKPDPENIHWLSDNDEISSNFPSWPDLSCTNIWRASTEMSTKENILDKEQSREMSFFARELGHTFGEVTKTQIQEGLNFDPSPCSSDEADSDFEINLPDEDSLITVDETYIFQEDTKNQTPEFPLKGGWNIFSFPGSNKPIQTDTPHWTPITPDPWVNNSQLNFAQMFVNPYNIQADFGGPSQYTDPWRLNQFNHGPFPANQVSYGQLPVAPQVYGPPFQNFLSPRMPQAHSFYPHHNNTLPNVPLSYCQAAQMPCRKKEPDQLRMKGRHGEDGIRPTFSQIIKMQIQMAQMKLQAVPGFEKKGLRQPYQKLA
ncbi:uncharacterized protein LOC141639518 isoform X2 [Silene latifolia]|uniref:uncharacterized protein LOC141639518 isoform X2 n=1 Tax=Silene latifolia TaxID=37657 RepID=UPI003D776E5F